MSALSYQGEQMFQPGVVYLFVVKDKIMISSGKNTETHKSVSSGTIEAASLDTLINSMPDAVYIGDFTGIKRCNQLALDMLGVKSIEELNENVGIVAEKINTRNAETGKRQTVEEEVFYKALMGQSVVQEVLVTNVLSKSDVYIRCTGAPVVVDGKVVGAITINSNITAQVNSKKTADEAMKELRKKNEALDKFVYITSHDLKAPLSSIGPLLDIIQEEYGNKVLDAEGIKMLEMAQEKVSQMNDLIHSLLSTAMQEEKVKEPVDLFELTGSIVKNINAPRSVNIYINHHLPVVKYHKVSLIQIFQNILGNAIKFINKEKGIIKIDCSESEDSYTISITDNGIGIPKDDLEKIFGKFHIGHKDPGKDSSGLGLSIVRDLVEENHGKIWAESTEGEGTTFYFTILKH